MQKVIKKIPQSLGSEKYRQHADKFDQVINHVYLDAKDLLWHHTGLAIKQQGGCSDHTWVHSIANNVHANQINTVIVNTERKKIANNDNKRLWSVQKPEEMFDVFVWEMYCGSMWILFIPSSPTLWRGVSIRCFIILFWSIPGVFSVIVCYSILILIFEIWSFLTDFNQAMRKCNHCLAIFSFFWVHQCLLSCIPQGESPVPIEIAIYMKYIGRYIYVYICGATYPQL